MLSSVDLILKDESFTLELATERSSCNSTAKAVRVESCQYHCHDSEACPRHFGSLRWSKKKYVYNASHYVTRSLLREHRVVQCQDRG